MVTESEQPTIFIQNHQGLGDMLVANAIFRHFAKTHNVILAVKTHNLPSVQFMLRDLSVGLLAVTNDEQVKRLVGVAEKRGVEVLRLGMFNPPFDEHQWDREFYRQAGIPFEKRWSEWKVGRDLSQEIKPPTEPYIFFHQDSTRNFLIDLDRVQTDLPCAIPVPGKADTIFDYCRLIENASEIHVIDSCFAILADSLPNLKAKRKVVHLYATIKVKTAGPPTYKNDWEILR